MATGWNSSSGADLLRVLRATKDAATLDRLLSQYLPLAHRIAGKFQDSGGCLEEITQAATTGLYQAILEYNLGLEQEVVALAVPVIVGNIKDCLREQVRGEKGVRKLEIHKLAVGRAEASITRDVNRPPTVAELARYTGLSKEQVCETFEFEMVSGSMPTVAGGPPDVAGTNSSSPDDQAQEELYLTPPKGRSDGSASGPARRSRSKAELLI